MQREGDRSEITGVTWKNQPELSIGSRSSGRAGGHFQTCHRNQPDHPGESIRMTTQIKRPILLSTIIAALFLATGTLCAQQLPADYSRPEQNAPITYTPKFPGDPARSDSEAAALAYMRVVIRAQRQFNRQYSRFAT